MSIPRHHAEWLSLIETSGPFLSLPVLLRVFPQGLDAHDPELAGPLRLAHAEWEENRDARFPDPAIHQAWVDFVLTTVLELPADRLRAGQSLPPGLSVSLPERGETLRPDRALVDPAGGQVRLLVQVSEPGQQLERPVSGRWWKASPATRMLELLLGTGLRLGLVTNGEQWLLVHVPPGESAGFASWYAPLWLEEPLTLRAFRSLLRSGRFFGVPEPDRLEALYAESAANQQEVTDQLGYQVRRAVEVLVQAIDRIDRDRGGVLLAGVSETELYQAALTVMMRLVFLFSAEERSLLLLGDPLYDQHYAVSTLGAQLRESADRHGEEVLERRRDAWSRLLAAFRAVHAGVEHEAMRLPPYGGTLFDPDRFPFLEGRSRETAWRDTPAEPLPIHNRAVLHLLEALQILQVKVPGGGPAEGRRLSFRALDIEQIGHVYEGLLDHGAVRAAGPVLGLAGTRDREPEVPLESLEAHAARGEDALVAFLREQTGRSPSALLHALSQPAPLSHSTGGNSPRIGGRGADPSSPRLLTACHHDAALIARVLPFAALLRDDTSGYPVVIPASGVYVTQSSERRSTGTHYTPRSLTAPIVQHALEPLVYDGPAEGRPRAEWKLRSAAEILALKVCDPAMGSGAFLVQACRYLAERLAEAWDAEASAAAAAPPGVGPGGRGRDRGADPGGRGGPPFLSRPPSPDVEKAGMRTEPGGGGRDAPPFFSRSPFSTSGEGRDEDGAGGRGPGGRPLGSTASPRTSPAAAPSAGLPAERLLPADAEERLSLARRLVADHCLYGVDKNPMAVEMAKLSLWLITLAKGKPFTFLDHRLRRGDSLVGCTWREASTGKILSLPAGIPAEAYAPLPGEDRAVAAALRKRNEGGFYQPALAMGAAADGPKGRDYERLAELPDTPDGMRERAARYAALRRTPVAVRQQAGADLWCAAWFWPLNRETGPLCPTTDLYRAVLERAGKVEKDVAVETERLRARFPFFHWPLEFPDVYEHGGFDAVVSNPPFRGGKLISGILGTDYREFLVHTLAAGARGSADFCAYFFLRAARLLRPGGMLGMLATNTLAQGDTREVGLDRLLSEGVTIARAEASRKWPGTANLEVAVLWLRRGEWRGDRVLDHRPVPGITAYLAPPGEALGTPRRLAANERKSFIGAFLRGMGFVLTPDEARALIARDPRNAAVLFPYLNGQDLNSRPDQSPSRWVINFRDWPLDRKTAPSGYAGPVAADYPDCLALVQERVKRERQALSESAIDRTHKERWWQFANHRPALYAAIADLDRLLVATRVSAHHFLALVGTQVVFSDRLCVLSLETWRALSLLNSTVHDLWAHRPGITTHETRQMYNPEEAFETFPFPVDLTPLEPIGERYHAHRQSVMLARQEGLTKTYNRFHNPQETAADIRELRSLHVEMDHAVAAAYGWTDLDLGHGFHPTGQGVRYTLAPPARQQVLDRLLRLNHARYAEELKAGLHEKKKKPRGSSSG